MNHGIHPEAEAELGDAAVYYAMHASPAIAEAFLVEYERVRDLIIENQQRGPHAEDGLREEDEAAGPQIYAVAHQAREPGYWRGRT